MLTRSSQIGEFYVMAPPQVEPSEKNGKFSCDLLIYDEESDRHVRIRWRDALNACLVDAAEGTNNNQAIQMTGGDSTSWKTMAGYWADFSDTGNGYEQAKRGAVPSTENATSTAGLDIRIVLARPFIECVLHRQPFQSRNLWLTATRAACAQAPHAQRHPHGRGQGHGRHAFRPG